MPKRKYTSQYGMARRTRPRRFVRRSQVTSYVRRPSMRAPSAGTWSIPRYLNDWQRNKDAPFPDRMSVKLLYSDVKTLALGAGGSSQTVFRLNSIFDPDFTGVGHQPRGHDELALMYRRYYVTGCKYEIVPYWAGQSSEPVVKWSAFLTQNSGTTIISANNYDMEESCLRIAPVGYFGGATNQFNNTTINSKVSGYIDLKSVYGVNSVKDDSGAESGFGSNPDRSAFLVIAAANTNASVVSNIAFSVTLTYYTTCLRPVSLSAS